MAAKRIGGAPTAKSQIRPSHAQKQPGSPYRSGRSKLLGESAKLRLSFPAKEKIQQQLLPTSSGPRSSCSKSVGLHARASQRLGEWSNWQAGWVGLGR